MQLGSCRHLCREQGRGGRAGGGYIGYILGLYRNNGKENGNYYLWLYGDFRGIYWGYIRIIENKMETAIMGYIGIMRYILGLSWDSTI